MRRRLLGKVNDVAPAVRVFLQSIQVFEQKRYGNIDAYNDERYDSREDENFKIIFYLFRIPLGLSTEGIKDATGGFAGEFLEKYSSTKDQRYNEKKLRSSQKS